MYHLRPLRARSTIDDVAARFTRATYPYLLGTKKSPDTIPRLLKWFCKQLKQLFPRKTNSRDPKPNNAIDAGSGTSTESNSTSRDTIVLSVKLNPPKNAIAIKRQTTRI